MDKEVFVSQMGGACRDLEAGLRAARPQLEPEVLTLLTHLVTWQSRALADVRALIEGFGETHEYWSLASHDLDGWIAGDVAGVPPDVRSAIQSLRSIVGQSITYVQGVDRTDLHKEINTSTGTRISVQALLYNQVEHLREHTLHMNRLTVGESGQFSA